jgi:hypothetical protein
MPTARHRRGAQAATLGRPLAVLFLLLAQPAPLFVVSRPRKQAAVLAACDFSVRPKLERAHLASGHRVLTAIPT